MSKIKKLGKDKTTIFIILIIVLVLGIWGVPKLRNNDVGQVNKEVKHEIDGLFEDNEMTKVKLTTNHGDIVIELYNDMPITVGNFENLVKQGTYDGVIFHRIIAGFMIQGGDPTGTGMGDQSIPNIKDEFTHADGNKNNRGTISMANAGPNTGSSQFFINLIDNNFLDGKHPTFGEVVEGIDVIDEIAGVLTGAGDKPVEDVVIEKAVVI